MTERVSPVGNGTKMSKEEARNFVLNNWGKEWTVAKLVEKTGWSNQSISIFRRESIDTREYDFSQYAPASVFMSDYGYTRPAFQSLIYNARRRLRQAGKELRTEVRKSPDLYQDVVYYNLQDVESVSLAFREKRYYLKLTKLLKGHTGEIPSDLTEEENLVFLTLIAWYILYPYEGSPTLRHLGEVWGMSFSSVGARIRRLLAAKYIDRRISMAGGKKVEYRILKAPDALHVELIKRNPFLVQPFGKKG